jgi:hypothetical protein
MTLLGKILTVFVLILSLLWVGLSVNVYATRANWAAEAKASADAAKATAESANAQRKIAEATRDLANAQATAARQEILRITTERDTLQREAAQAKDELNKKLALDQQGESRETLLQTNVQKLQKQVDLLQARLGEVETQANNAIIAAEVARGNEVKANLDKQAALGRAEKLEADFLKQQDVLNALRNGGRGSAAELAPPDDFKATVQEVSGDLVSINLGANAKLQKGAILDISRTKPSPKYVGTITIVSVDPYGATGRFKPRVGVTRASGDDLPKPGDIAGVVK